MLKVGLEPTRPHEQQILSLPWLPLHHSSIYKALFVELKNSVHFFSSNTNVLLLGPFIINCGVHARPYSHYVLPYNIDSALSIMNSRTLSLRSNLGRLHLTQPQDVATGVISAPRRW